MSLIDKETLQCQFCGFQRKKIEVLVTHLGSVHDKLQDFLPLQFHLPKSKPGKYSKTSSTSQSLPQPSTEPGPSVNSHREEQNPRTIDPDLRNIRDIFDS